MRVRTDLVFGTVTDDPLAVGALTLNSAGLTNLAAVVAPDEAIIVLDPNREHGAPEIVRVTAHTGSATSATITRQQFGTSARAHPAGTEWVHGPIASDSTTLVDPAADQGDYVPMGKWQDYTPTFTNFTLGNGTINYAKFTRIGRTIHFRVGVTLGSTSSMGNDPKMTIPVTSAVYNTGVPIGICHLLDAGTANHHGTAMLAGSTTAVTLRYLNAGATSLSQSQVNTTNPFTWTTSDTFNVVGTYEAAS